MSADVTVRPATLADLDTIVELRLALLREYGDHPMYGRLRADADVRAPEFFRTQLASHLEVMLVAEVHGALVGILRCVDSASSPLLRPERYCYVSSAYVRPAYRRGGVLRALMAAAETWCVERGLDEIRLHNAVSSPAAVAAWSALGFDVVEQVRRRTVVARPRTGLRVTHAEAR